MRRISRLFYLFVGRRNLTILPEKGIFLLHDNLELFKAVDHYIALSVKNKLPVSAKPSALIMS